MAKKWMGNKSYTEYTSSTGGVGCAAYDATGAGSAVASGTNSVNITWTHTASGSNRFVVVFVMVGGVSAAASTFTKSATYGGVAMTFLTAQDGPSTNGWVEAWAIANPATGAQTVSYTVSKSSTTFGRVAGNSVSYTNCSGTYGYAGGTSLSAGTGVAFNREWSSFDLGLRIAGGISVSMIAVDSLRTITTNYNLNHYGESGQPITYNKENATRWTSNSGSTSGMTSCMIGELPGTPYVQHTILTNSSGNFASIAVLIEGLGATIPSGVSGCWLTMIGAGGGGGAGRQGTSTTNRWGGDGGGGGAMVNERYIPLSALSTKYSLYVPPVATGGVATGTVAVDGPIGYRSLDVMFSSNNLTISCGSGMGGQGGKAAVWTNASKGARTGSQSGLGGNGGAGAAGPGNAGQSSLYGADLNGAGGGAGGGITLGGIAGAGADGGSNLENAFTGGAGGTVGVASPGAGSAAAPGLSGSGAGGGGASNTGTPQSGASATGYGGGGGGGGCSATGTTAGSGGNGGPAYAKIMWDYR